MKKTEKRSGKDCPLCGKFLISDSVQRIFNCPDCKNSFLVDDDGAYTDKDEGDVVIICPRCKEAWYSDIPGLFECTTCFLQFEVNKEGIYIEHPDSTDLDERGTQSPVSDTFALGKQQQLILTQRIGYISVLSNQDVHLGGLVVVDADGDPVEFTHTDAMKLAPLMSTLLGQRLPGFVATRLIAGPLLDCCTIKPDVVCFDEATVLHRCIDLGIPVAVFAPTNFMGAGAYWQRLDPQPGDGNQDGEWWGQSSCCQQVQSALHDSALYMMPSNLLYPFERLGEALKQMHLQYSRG